MRIAKPFTLDRAYSQWDYPEKFARPEHPSDRDVFGRLTNLQITEKMNIHESKTT